MIYSTGFVTVVAKSKEKQIGKLKRDTLLLEKIEEEMDGSSLKIKYRYTAFLPRSFECQTLEDYTGKIKPFIQRHLENIIVSVQVTHLNYVSKNAILRKKNN